MKSIKNIIVGAMALGLLFGCEEGIDPISRVKPGPDEAAPEVTINYPAEGTMIQVAEDVTTLNIDFEVIDDIEIESVSLNLDGTEIAKFNSFKDYRRAVQVYAYDELTNGAHTLTVTGKDLSGKTTSKSVTFQKVEPYDPLYDGEIFYMPFNGDYMELVSIKNATKVGSPGFADTGVDGKAYAGANDAYLTYPTDGLKNQEFSAAFWYKVDASPDRSGILTMGPPDAANPSAPNNRKHGFRLFRENAGGKQRIKLNVGNGTADSWFDGGAAADIDPAAGQWVHVAFTISPTKCAVYLNGNVVSQGNFAGVSWADCDILSIASGAPRFTEWNHLSDRSLYDELRIFNKALTQAEIQAMME